MKNTKHTAPETAKERDRLKEINDELLEALETVLKAHDAERDRLKEINAELLEALEQMMRDLEEAEKNALIFSNEDYDIGRYDALYQLSGMARAAIKKAKGE